MKIFLLYLIELFERGFKVQMNLYLSFVRLVDWLFNWLIYLVGVDQLIGCVIATE